jgi:hypothetical protein
MMQLTCPCCHAHIPLESAMQDDAGRELVALLLALPPDLARALVHYLSFFRPLKQQLGWGRALRLSREVQALEVDAGRLQAGLVEVARTLGERRQAAGWKPLGNHNYLRRCLETVEASAVAAMAPSGVVPRSRAGAGLVALEGMKR